MNQRRDRKLDRVKIACMCTDTSTGTSHIKLVRKVADGVGPEILLFKMESKIFNKRIIVQIFSNPVLM